ncbi:reverse transcriptase domain-containing protein [Tanacetum coccineum]
MEENVQPYYQHQRRVNPKIHEVIKQEVIKLLDAGLIYPISDSPWITGNEVLVAFLDGFSGYFQIPIDPLDQEKTTFTCPYRTFAYRRMPFGLCNALARIKRCSCKSFNDMIKKTMKTHPWIDVISFSVFGDSFSSCLSHLDKMLQRCEDTNLVLNWEKCHFMVKEGIVLGHKISKSGIEVDKAKVDVIAKLPHPTTEKVIRSSFSTECIEAFETLKMKLTQAPILVAPDWDLPFEIMCDASDFAVGAVLGQQISGHILSNPKDIVYIDDTTTGSKYLLAKNQDAKPRMLRWILAAPRI